MNTEVPPLLQKWLDRLEGVKHQGDLQYKARCPAHDDEKASLEVSWGDKGKVLAYCHASCTFAQIVAKLGLTKNDLDPKPVITHKYDYRDEDGVLKYQVTRWEPKEFRQRRPNPNYREDGKQWLHDMKGVELLPFNLPAVAELVEHGTAEDELWIVEGEKDALAIEQAWGAVATCNSGGAGKWTDAHSEYLRGFKGQLVIVIDNDDKPTKPGQKHALAVYESVLRVAGIEGELVYPVEGKDAADVVGKYDPAEGFVPIAPDDLRTEVADAASDAPDGEVDDVLTAIRQLFHAEEEHRIDLFDTLMSDDDVLELTPPRYVIDKWLPMGFFSDLFGAPGSKKTFVILDMLRCIASGQRWQGYDVQRGATILFEGEGLEQLQGRILAWNEGYEVFDPIPARWTDASVNMTTPEGVAAVVRTVQRFESHIGMPVVAVGFDPLVEYMAGNEVDGGNELATRGLRALAKHLNIAVVAGVHTNAAGERARGSDHLRMRSGAHVKVETLPDGNVGLVQEKLKNDTERAVVLLPQTVGPSLVLDKIDDLPASEYVARRIEEENEGRRRGRERAKESHDTSQDARADELLLAAIAAKPGLSRGKVLTACNGVGVGKPRLERRLDVLTADGGPVRTVKQGTATNAPTYHYINEEI